MPGIWLVGELGEGGCAAAAARRGLGNTKILEATPKKLITRWGRVGVVAGVAAVGAQVFSHILTIQNLANRPESRPLPAKRLYFNS